MMMRTRQTRFRGAAQYLDMPLLHVGAGVVTGVNQHRGRHVSAGLTLGYDINATVFEYPAPIDIQYRGTTHRVWVGMTILHRLGNDVFERDAPVASRR